MASYLKKHRLTEVNLQQRTAKCVICGPTQIRLESIQDRLLPHVYCAKDADVRAQRHEEKRLQLNQKRRRPPNKNIHRLTNVNVETRTATCSVCGPTDIYGVGNQNPIRCASRSRLSKNKKELHRLTNINIETRTATCSVCGPTGIYGMPNRYSIRCANKVRLSKDKVVSYHRLGRLSKSHILSDIDKEKRTAVCSRCGPIAIRFSNPRSPAYREPAEVRQQRIADNKKLVQTYMRQHACKRCGVRDPNPNNFKFLQIHLPRAQKIGELIRSATSEQLLAEMEKRDMYCRSCHRYKTNEYSRGIPVPPLKQFTGI
jgi:hypothetical protein